MLSELSTYQKINVFLRARIGALLRWLLLAVLAVRRTRRLASYPVLFAKIHIISGQALKPTETSSYENRSTSHANSPDFFVGVCWRG
jgi:hypothetical protein